jgi:hypothetical protein
MKNEPENELTDSGYALLDFLQRLCLLPVILLQYLLPPICLSPGNLSISCVDIQPIREK